MVQVVIDQQVVLLLVLSLGLGWYLAWPSESSEQTGKGEPGEENLVLDAEFDTDARYILSLSPSIVEK